MWGDGCGDYMAVAVRERKAPMTATPPGVALRVLPVLAFLRFGHMACSLGDLEWLILLNKYFRL